MIESRPLVFFACLLFVVGCATASAPDVGPTDGSTTHDSSIGDSGTSDTTASDTPSDAPFDGPCVAPKKICGGTCTDVSSDRNNCGACGVSCGETGTCGGGTCACGKDEVSCSGVCANLLSSHDHCGDCTTKCKDTEACVDAVCKLDCSTKPGTTACGTTCVDLKTDNANCGACFTACKPDQACVGGVCKCPGTEIVCTSGFPATPKCTDTTSDNNNCGGCGVVCDTFSGKTCVSSACACGAPKVACPGVTACVDLSSDNAHCGACGTACDTTKSMACKASKCVLDCGTRTDCSGTCVDTMSDAANCGGCGVACAAGQFCSGGVCTCTSGLTNCSGVCKDLKTDGSNCGLCGRACTGGLVCSGGSCGATCGGGRMACGSSCIDTSSDDSNCGSCGHVCSGATPHCSGGTCVSAPKCNSGSFKVLFYGDVGSLESSYLPPGSTTTIATGATWSSMTTAEFASYQLIVIGEGKYGTPTAWDNANTTKATWSAAINGRIVVHTLDPVAHSGVVGATTFIKAALNWAATGPGTGLYVGPDYGSRHLDFMSAFGSWTLLGQTDSGYAGDTVHVVLPSHGTMTGSTDASMSSWSYSFHGGMTAIASTFVTVAQGTGSSGGGTVTSTVVAARDATCLP